jgi:fructose/tagatose bisphosphate aldolase
MGQLLKGRQLRRIFDHFCPFDDDGKLKPAEKQVTLLAANSNNWWQTRAFVQVAAVGKQSPIVVQFSHNANSKIGGQPGKAFTPEGLGYRGNPVVHGGKAMASWIDLEVEAWGADLVAASLDHFAVPKFDPEKEYAQRAMATGCSEKVEAAMAFIESKGLGHMMEDMSGGLDEKYVAYLTSDEYQQFRSDFQDTVTVIQPAWGMIDTEGIPPVLDFAITRDIADAVRVELANHDMMLEAELGETGQSGDEVEYEVMSDEELSDFAELAAAFVEYTGAEGIAYDIGMKHAAKQDEKHEVDVRKLETVQKRIIDKVGIYAAFAQHGGTGAAEVTKGLVGKTNVNTQFLVDGSIARYKHFDAVGEAVLSGDKKACGTDVETHVYLGALYESALERIKTTGSFETGPECMEALGW